MTKLSFFTLALISGVGCAVVACSSSGDDTAATGGTGGSGGTTSTAGKGGTTSAAGKGGSSNTAGTTAGGAGGDAGTIYDRLGGDTGIKGAVDAIVAAEVADTEIASYFSQSSDPAYSPSVTDIKECLVLQLDSATGGPQTYLGTKVTSGFACQSMAAAHADLGINSGTFDKFVMIAAGVLTDAGVSAADLGVIAGVLNGTKATIVTASPDSDTERACTAPAACAAAAGAGGAG